MNLIDRLNMTTPDEATRAAFSMLDRGQNLTPSALIAGGAVFLLMLCNRFNTDPRQAMVRAERMLKDAADDPDRGKYVRMRALEDYLNKELS